MSHGYYERSVWRYSSALDPKCLYETVEEARKADRQTAIFIIFEQTPSTLSAAITILNKSLRDALTFLVDEMSDAHEPADRELQP